MLRSPARLLPIVLALCLPAFAWADSEAAPRDYSLVLAGGALIFVMLAPAEYSDRHEPALRRRFSKSGLFPATGAEAAPAEPEWTVDWYAFRVELSSDARYLVRHGDWARETDDLAVAFYDRGRLLAEWRVDQLVRDPRRLPRSVSHLEWLHRAQLDVFTGTFQIVTLHAEHYQFELATGRVCASRLPAPGIPATDGFIADDAVALLAAPEVATRRLGALALQRLATARFGDWPQPEPPGGHTHLRERAGPALQAATADPDATVARHARIALAHLGAARPKDLVALASELGDVEQAGELLQALLAAGPLPAELPIQGLLANLGWFVEPPLAEARLLAALAPKQQDLVKSLALVLDDAEVTRRRGAAFVLSELGSAALGELAAIIRGAQQRDWLTSTHCIRALAAAGPAAREAIPVLEAMRGTRTERQAELLDELLDEALARLRA